MKQERHYGYMRDGRLKCQSLAAAVRMYPEGTQLEFTVRKSIERRTNPQNRYFHGVVLSIAARTISENGTPITAGQLKEAWKLMFSPIDIPTQCGEFITIGKSTAEMDKEEFISFIDHCVAWCAEQGIVIPAPGEQTELDIAS